MKYSPFIIGTTKERGITMEKRIDEYEAYLKEQELAEARSVPISDTQGRSNKEWNCREHRRKQSLSINRTLKKRKRLRPLLILP